MPPISLQFIINYDGAMLDTLQYPEYTELVPDLFSLLLPPKLICKTTKGETMSKSKEIKTNAMRILESMKIPYTQYTYECDEFIDAIQIADSLGLPHEEVYKTLVTRGAHDYFVFVIPIHRELDLKAAARSVGEKSVEMIPVKDINAVTGYIRGGCTAIGMKKQYVTRLDASAESRPAIIVSGGRIGSQIKLSPKGLLTAARASYADVVRQDEP